jgi:30S ribosomal protein S31
MGKGDKKTKKGKIIMGSYGVKRKHPASKTVHTPAIKPKEAPAAEAEVHLADADAAEKELKKAAAKKKAPAKPEHKEEVVETTAVVEEIAEEKAEEIVETPLAEETTTPEEA